MRIRTVKPEFWSSPDTAACRDPWARLLFIAMWNWADDVGRGTANPKELAGFAFPNDEEIDSTSLRRMLGEVSNAFGVILYEVADRPYYEIPSFGRHQKIDRSSGAKHPPPSDGNPWDPTTPDQPFSRNGRRGVDESSTSPRRGLGEPSGTGTGEQGNRGTKRLSRPRDTLATPSRGLDEGSTRFAEFYAAYPRKKDPRSTERAWRAAIKRGADPDQVITAAKAYAAVGAPLQFVKYPATWLNAEAYLNEPELANVHSIRRNGRSPSSYDDNGEPLRDPKTGVWMEL